MAFIKGNKFIKVELDTGKERFIQEWGTLGTSWGINKTMAQIHALLLTAPEAYSADRVQDELNISAGSANTNLRTLVEWQLIHKIDKEGCRKDFYEAEKDMWKIFSSIIVQRKKKELDPMISLLEELSNVEGKCSGSKEFCKLVNDLRVFSERADKALDNLCSTQSKWLINGMMKVMR